MSSLTVAVYTIDPPSGVTREGFEKFMDKEVFPAVFTGPSRAGQVTGQRLFKGVGDTNKYIWVVEYTRMGGSESPSGKAGIAEDKLKAYGTQVTCLGDYDELDINLGEKTE